MIERGEERLRLIEARGEAVAHEPLEADLVPVDELVEDRVERRRIQRAATPPHTKACSCVICSGRAACQDRGAR